MQDDIIKSGKQFAGNATDLLDTEIQQAMQIVVALQRKYATRPNTPQMLDQLRDEALTRMAEIGILATLDPAPVFYGEPPILEILGKVGDIGFKAPMDHEKKRAEVIKSKVRNEEYLGQKERPNSRRPKK